MSKPLAIARVFPRRTAYTPDDALAFVGEPPLWPVDGVDEIYVSCTFSWDRSEAERLAEAWESSYPGKVRLGGPAYGDASGDFVPGRYVKAGITFTSRGCIRRCPFCAVPKREGAIRLLSPIPEGYVVQDNNFLATPKSHRERVYEMLSRQRRYAIFSGGIDARLVTDEVADEFRRINVSEIFLAADTDGAIAPLREAVKRLAFLGRRKLRCYALIGFGGETIAHAEERLETLWEIGVLPFAQVYRPLDSDDRFTPSPEWRALHRTWARPAAMFAAHKKELEATE